MASFRQNPNTGKWSFVIDIGSDPLTGKRKQKTVSKDNNGKVFDTERDARKYALKMEQDIERGKRFDSVTMEHFMTDFFKRVVSEQVSEVTYDNQWQIARNYIIPYLGKVKVEKITDAHIENLYERLLNDEVERGIIRNVSIVISKTLSHAQKKKLIVDNPMKIVTKPSYKPAKAAVWSREQVMQFLDGTRDSKFYALYVTASETGMRRSELLALLWKDVDIDNKTITINKALKYSSASKLHVRNPKTENSRRTIRIPQKVVDVLNEHKTKQMENVPIVFDNLGEYFRLGELSRYFQVDRERVGLPYATFHGLRHAHATYLLSKRFSARVVADRLGDTVATVLETYAHVLHSMQDEVASTLDDDWG